MSVLLDMESHNGLRGFCCLWVLIFHSVNFGSYGNIVDLNGSVAMPIFFILSGFSLGVVYGKKDKVDKLTFYRNRFVRIYPVYVLTTMLAFGLYWTNFGYIGLEIVYNVPVYDWAKMWGINLLLINFWLVGLPINYIPINPPAWFVSVLWFQYAVFPYTLPVMKRIKNRCTWIAAFYLIPCIVSPYIYLSTNLLYYGTMNVFSPGFCMFHAGILCGLWAEEENSRICNGKSSVDISLTDGSNDYNNNKDVRESTSKWARRTDFSASLFFGYLCISSIFTFFGHGVNTEFWFQIYGSFLSLFFIVSLTLDGGKSGFGKLCRLPILMWTNKVGMSVYLVHEPIIRWTCVIVEKFTPSQFHITGYYPMFGGAMPYWGIFITVPVSLIVGAALEKFVAVPCRKMGKSKLSFGTEKKAFGIFKL